MSDFCSWHFVVDRLDRWTEIKTQMWPFYPNKFTTTTTLKVRWKRMNETSSLSQPVVRKWSSHLFSRYFAHVENLTMASQKPVVNFTNILQAAFAPIYLRKKSTNLQCKYIKSALKTFIHKSCSYNVGEIDTGWEEKKWQWLSMDCLMYSYCSFIISVYSLGHYDKDY